MNISPPRQPLMRLAPIVLVATMACVPGAEQAGVSESGPATDDLLTLLPGEAVFVGWADVDALRESSSGAALLDEDSQSDEDYEDLRWLAEATGIEMEDIHRAAFAGLGDVADDAEAQVVAAAKVDYDPNRMTETLADRPTLSYRDRTLYELDESMWNDGEDEESGGDHEGEDPAGEHEQDAAGEEEDPGEQEPPYLVMLDADTLLLGNERGVKASLDTIDDEATSLRDNAPMVENIESASEGSQAWLVVMRDAWREQLGDMPEQGMVSRSAIEGIELMTVSLGVEEGFMLRIAGMAATEEDAGLLADSLRGVVSMGKMMIQQEPEIFAILDEGITVSADGRELRLEARLTDAQLEALQQYAEEQMPAAEGAGTRGV